MTDRRTIQMVIALLGSCALLLVVGSMALTLVVIRQAGERDVTPTAVAVLGSVTGLAGTALGALGSLLVSTRSMPPEEEDPSA